MATIRIALLTIRLVMRTKAALFFTFFFPLIFLFAYAGIFAHGDPQAVAYMFGPVVTLNIMGSGFWGLGLQSVMQRERGSLRRYRLAPIGPGTIVSSNLLANYLLQLPTIGLLFFCARVFFHMPLKIGVLTLLALVTIGTFAFAGFGLTIASIANTMQEAQIYNNLAWLTLLFLSGVTFPLPMLPHWIQRVATFLPATYLVSSFQAVMVQRQPLLKYWPEMLGLIVSGSFGLLFAFKLFRWEKEERIPNRRKLAALAFVIPFLLVGVWMNARSNPTAKWAAVYSMLDRGRNTASQKPDSTLVIADFESPQAAEDLLKRWVLVLPPDAAGHSSAKISLISPGAAETQHALRLKGRLSSTGKDNAASVTARYSFLLPAGKKALRGIEFWARGDSRVYQIGVIPSATAGSLHPALSLVPGAEWQNVKLPVAWLNDSAYQAVSWNLEIVVTGPSGDFSVDVDEIKFY